MSHRRNSAPTKWQVHHTNYESYHETDLIAEFVGFLRAEWPAVLTGAIGLAALYGLVLLMGLMKLWGWF